MSARRAPATALAAALGVGIGTVIRNQVGAVIAVLSLLYAGIGHTQLRR